MKKAVTNSGDWDGTVLYLRDGVAAGASAGRICETQDGSDTLVQQFIHGTQYIDELVMVQVMNKGDLYIHQAERDRRGSVKDWKGVALTNLGRRLVKRYV